MTADKLSLVRVDKDSLINFIDQAQQKLIVIKPAYYSYEIKALLGAAKREVECKVFLESSDQSTRFGFGDTEALKLIFENSHIINTKAVDRIRMAVVVVDDETLLFSPDILFMEQENKQNDFPNGVVCGVEITDSILKEVEAIEIGSLAEVKGEKVVLFPGGRVSCKGNNDMRSEIKESLDKLRVNPPVDPTKLRKVNFYRNNYKLVKLTVCGVKIKNKRLNLRQFIALLKNQDKRLLQSWRIFTPEDVKQLEDTVFFHEELKTIEEEYLSDAGRFGFIIKTEDVSEFKKKLDAMKREYTEYLKGNKDKGKTKDKNRFVKRALKSDKDNRADINKILANSKVKLITHLKDIATRDPEFDNCFRKLNRHLDKRIIEGLPVANARSQFIEEFIDNILKFPGKEEIVDHIDIKVDIYDASDELLYNNEDFKEILEGHHTLEMRKYNLGYEQQNQT